VTRLAAVLIVVTGLLTFHPPHFLLEARRHPSAAGETALKTALTILLLGALAAAVGISRDAWWAWALGLGIAVVAIALYVVQQTIGLPGLPKNWAEPSRIVSLAVQVLFIMLALRRLRPGRPAVTATSPTPPAS
jgi:uncharacterized membrane protein YhdT